MDQDLIKIEKRMDKFDSIVTEYLRSSGFTTDELAMKLGINKTSLWRYRKQPYAFAKAPFAVITKAMRLAKISNETMRYICGM
jgi:hypothetical protein